MTRPWRSEEVATSISSMMASRWWRGIRSRRSAGSSRGCGSGTSAVSGSRPEERHAAVVDHDHLAVAPHDRPHGGEIERHDRYVLDVDILPHVELGPVRQREHADRFALVLAGVVEVPQLGTLVLRVPAVPGSRNEKIRSLARDFSSSRRAPPKAASKPYLSRACLRPRSS